MNKDKWKLSEISTFFSFCKVDDTISARQATCNFIGISSESNVIVLFVARLVNNNRQTDMTLRALRPSITPGIHFSMTKTHGFPIKCSEWSNQQTEHSNATPDPVFRGEKEGPSTRVYIRRILALWGKTETTRERRKERRRERERAVPITPPTVTGLSDSLMRFKWEGRGPHVVAGGV